MKVLALGGCGQEGKTTVKDLIKSEKVSKVVIADIDIERANKFAAELGSKKVSTLHLDVNDRVRLTEAMKEADVVVNFAGPFYKHGVKVLQAAIETRKNYVDICDDCDATQEMLALDKSAKNAGITALIGLGVSPGVTNMMAKYGANKLESVEEIHVKWIVSVTDVEEPGESAAVYHGLHMVHGNVPQYLDGKLVGVPALSGSERVEFPEIGECEVYYVGHPEPATLPRYVKGVKVVTCKGGVPGADEVLKAFAAFGLCGIEPISVKGTVVAPRDIALGIFGGLPAREEIPPVSAFKVWVKGKKGEDSVQYVYTCFGRMSPWTGVPASIGTQMVGRGDIQAKGVLAPEGCVDPEAFIAELAKRRLEVEEVEKKARLLK